MIAITEAAFYDLYEKVFGDNLDRRQLEPKFNFNDQTTCLLKKLS